MALVVADFVDLEVVDFQAHFHELGPGRGQHVHVEGVTVGDDFLHAAGTNERTDLAGEDAGDHVAHGLIVASQKAGAGLNDADYIFIHPVGERGLNVDGNILVSLGFNVDPHIAGTNVETVHPVDERQIEGAATHNNPEWHVFTGEESAGDEECLGGFRGGVKHDGPSFGG